MLKKFEKQTVALLLAIIMCVSMVFTGSISANAKETTENQFQKVKADTKNETAVGGTNSKVFYEFIPEQTGDYHFYSVGEEDTYGYVYDATHSLIASGNDGEENLNFDITIPMEEGQVYYLEVDYFLDITEGVIEWYIGLPEKTSEEIPVSESKIQKVETKEKATDLADTGRYGEYDYRELTDGTVEVVSYIGNDTQVEIPKVIAGKTVTSIGENAFFENTILQKVEIPETVTKLQYQAFGSCTNLVEVIVPKDGKLQIIGEGAFRECTKLKEFNVPNSTQTIEKKAFLSCSALQSVQFGKQMTTIGMAAFAECGVTGITIQDSIKEVGTSAFSGCAELEYVHLGKGISEIKASTFGSCSKLKNIIIPDNIKRIEGGAFNACGLEKIELPDTVEYIGDGAFSSCEHLKRAIVGNGVTEISDFAFLNCGLEEIQIGNRVEKIGLYAFCDNEKLRKISIPKNVTGIEYRGFAGCTNLEDVEFPDTLKRLGGRVLEETKWYENQAEGVVYANTVLYGYKGEMPQNTSVKVKDRTLGIGAFAFDGLKKLKSVEIPNSVTDIGEFAFFDCTSMKEVSIPDSVTTIEPYAFGCYGVKEGGKEIDWNDESGGSLGYWRYEIVPGFVIRGEADSEAERYAKEYGITFKKNIHTVTFKDGDTILKTQRVTSGEAAVPPAVKAKDGYRFAGWDTDYSNVKRDLVVTAKWNRLDGWQKTDDGWYYYETGKKVTGWKVIGEYYYYFKENGLMASDEWIGDYYVDKNGVWLKHYKPAHWVLTNGRWWYCEVDGSYPVSRWKNISNQWYYFDSYGYCVIGWNYIGGAWYYMDAGGAMTTGWIAVGGNWYYMNKDGSMSTGWIYVDRQWYYMNSNGSMHTGWLYIGGKWYYLKASGAMSIGWVAVGGSQYYMNSDGTMSTGWIYVDHQWYYMNSNGSMHTGWLYIGGKWYYLKASGAMNIGWVAVGGKWYYMNSDGTMTTGWISVDGYWYYMEPNGMMAASKWIGDYYVQGDGTMAVNKWIGNYYVGPDGRWIPNAEMTSMERDVARLVNKVRAENGKNALIYDEQISKAAEARAKELQWYFDHIRPNGTPWYTVMDEYNIFYETCGENIAYGSTSAEDVMQLWMDSPPHYANIMDDYTHIGVGHYKDSNGRDYWVQLFVQR